MGPCWPASMDLFTVYTVIRVAEPIRATPDKCDIHVRSHAPVGCGSGAKS